MNIKQIKLTDIIMVLLGIRTVLSASSISVLCSLISNVATIFLIFLCILKINKSGYSKYNYLLFVLLFLFTLYTGYVLGYYTFFIALLVLFSLKGTDINRDLKYLHISKLFLILIHILITFLCILLSIETTHIMDYNYGIRYSFFFEHPNTFSALVLGLLVEYIYLRFDKLKLVDIFGIIIFTVVTYYFTKSRTFLYLVFLIMLLLPFVKVKKRILKIFSRPFIIRVLLISVVFCSFVLMLYSSKENLQSNEFIGAIDGVLSRRLKYSNLAYENFGIHLFPTYADFDNTIVQVSKYVHTKLIVDNLYTNFFVQYGFLWLFILVYCVFRASRCFKPKDILLFIIMILSSITESYSINVGMTPYLIIIAYYLINGRGYINESKS